MKIIDGRMGEAHINGRQLADSHIGFFGDGDYALPVGDQLAITRISDNEIQIGDGLAVMQGVRAINLYGEKTPLYIENGTPGAQRNDIVVARYVLRDDGTEPVSLIVVQGEDNMGDPDINDGTDLRAGDTVHDMPLWRVKLDGAAVTGFDKMFSVYENLPAHTGKQPTNSGEDGVHGFRYYANQPQFYDGTEWLTLAVGEGDIAYPSFQAFVEQVSIEALSAAFGLGNESDVKHIGYQLYMYDNFMSMMEG